MSRRRRRLAVALAVLAAAALGITATSGFSSVVADRGVDVAVVSDDEAFLGVDLEETGVSDDRKAISFVGFCTDDGTEVEASANVTKYKSEVDPADAAGEALAVRWETDEPVSTVVLKTGGGKDIKGKNALENVHVGNDTAGEVAVSGEYDAGSDQSPDQFCPGDETEAEKLEAPGGLGVADDATAVGETLAVTVTNRFGEPLETVEVTGADATRDLASVGREELGVGESVTFTLEADCETVAVFAAGADTSVELDRDC